MSIIPKINVGLSGKKRAKLNLDFDNSTTMNIGDVQPTMCREMVPNETIKVKLSSLVRLAPMPVPTFARMSLRHYHSFVPYSELWQPFTAFLSGGTYTNNEGSTFVPKTAPEFNNAFVQNVVLAFSDISFYDPLHGPLTLTKDDTSRWNLIRRLLKEVKFPLPHPDSNGNFLYFTAYLSKYYNKQGKVGSVGMKDVSNAGGVVRLGGAYIATRHNLIDGYTADFPGFSSDQPAIDKDGVFADDTTGYVTPEGADYIIKVRDTATEYYACLKLKVPAKRLRSIFIGLGYSFDPFMDVRFNPFKLLAFYKSWYELFSPNRDITFNETSCYKVIKKASKSDSVKFKVNTLGMESGSFDEFIIDLLSDCYYYLPMDYFSMSTLKPYDQFHNVNQSVSPTDGGFGLNAGTGSYSLNDGIPVKENQVAISNSAATDIGGTPVTNLAGAADPLVIRLANRLLTFAGKNTVVGRQIQDYLRVHYGIIAGEHHADDSSVYRLGSSRVHINVSDIMSTADTQTAKVGDYAGKGIGYGDSDVTEYTAKEFGCWITLSVIVPESGYFQGYLRENRSFSRFDFFTPEFDALGYQILERGEIYNMRDTSTSSMKQDGGVHLSLQAFGFVPRYSHLKVGRNIVNGDLSLSGNSSMSSYHFDRMFPTRRKVVKGDVVTYEDPEYLPNVVTDSFRRLDPSDRLGNYNRIFNYVNSDSDHFIVHNIFNVTAIAPFKPLSECFDSVVEDDKVISVTKA